MVFFSDADSAPLPLADAPTVPAVALPLASRYLFHTVLQSTLREYPCERLVASGDEARGGATQRIGTKLDFVPFGDCEECRIRFASDLPCCVNIDIILGVL